MTGPVTYALDDSIATITLDDGKANVMTPTMQGALDGALDRAEADAAVVLLRGREGIFSGGYDRGMFALSREEIARTISQGGRLVERLLGFPRPVVAACTGHAIAQGAFLLLAADTRIGVRGPFKIGLNEVAIGLTIPHYGIEVSRLRLAAPQFNRATTTGFFHDPDEACRAGFLDRVVAPGELDEAARAEAVALTAIDPAAHVGTKQRVRGVALERIRAGIEDEFGAAALARAG